MPIRKPPRSRHLRQVPNILVVSTEGVDYVLDWDKFPIGAFVFIRCLETDRVVKLVKRSADRYGMKITTKVGERNNYWGVGIWRRK